MAYQSENDNNKRKIGTSLVVPRLRFHIPNAGAWVWSLVRELDPIVQFTCSVVSNFLPLHGPQHARPPCPSPTPRVYSNSCPSSQWFHPTISSSVIPFSLCLHKDVFPSIKVRTNESVLRIRWPKYWSFRFSISPSNEYSGLISFKMDWLDLLAAQGTLKSLLQHHSSKVSIIWHSAFFMAKLSYPYHISHDHWKKHSFD